MNTRTQNILAFASRNLRYGGVAFIITAAYIAYAQPSNLTVLMAPYSGDPVYLGGIMVAIGGFASLIGYSIKRWLDCKEQI
ncbi:MAG: hypothetical protein NWF07_15710 [Candidatus Bathyarchaeota archaeon]|nr:hypothetical protein [Candidatus Bathyarchaeota archaeon]